MKKFITAFVDILGHVLLVMAIPVFAFYILEICNPAMHFMTNGFTLGFIAAFALLYTVRFIFELIDKNGKNRS